MQTAIERKCKGWKSSFLLGSIYLLSVFLFPACRNKNQSEVLENWELISSPRTNIPIICLSPDTNSSFHCPVHNQLIRWESKNLANPAIISKNDTIFMVYGSEDNYNTHLHYWGTSRLGMAYSIDGYHFTKYPLPVIYPEQDQYNVWEWYGGIRNPRIVEGDSGRFVMTYTAWDGKTSRLCIATSEDLIHWKKHGSAFARFRDGKYIDLWSTSGTIVSRKIDNKLLAVKINEKYWMYWGDSNIYAATSDNLIDWEIVTDNNETEDMKYGKIGFRIIVKPREGKFDSELVEAGPLALLTDQGILFVYNGKNHPKNGDRELSPESYSASQILIDPDDPCRILKSSDHFFLNNASKTENADQSGNMQSIGGIFLLKSKFLIYYEQTDGMIAVVECDSNG